MELNHSFLHFSSSFFLFSLNSQLETEILPTQDTAVPLGADLHHVIHSCATLGHPKHTPCRGRARGFCGSGIVVHLDAAKDIVANETAKRVPITTIGAFFIIFFISFSTIYLARRYFMWVMV